MPTPLQIELNTKTFDTNTVIKIGDDFYAEKQVDSGLVIDAEKLVVDRPKINGVKIDIRKVTTPIGTASFILKDDILETTTIEIMKDETLFLEKDVIIFLGVIKGPSDPFDFSDYAEVSRTTLTSLKKVRNGYSVKSKQITHKLNQPALNFEQGLTTSLIPASLSLDIVDATNAPFTSGLIFVENEIMSFNGISGNTLQNLVRGIRQTDASEHSVGEAVQFMTEFDDVNPMTVLLQIMLSDTGDLSNHGVYDVLNGGLGMSPDEVDIATFEALATTEYLGEELDLLTFGEAKILKFMEDEVLSMAIARLISVNGKVSITVLDQVDNAEEVPEINEDAIIGTPTWGISSDKIVNRIIVFYDFNYGTGIYETQKTFNSEESQATFEVIKTLKLKWKGVTTNLDGAAIAQNRAGRFLERLQTARGTVKLKAHIDAAQTPVGENATIAHRYLPQEGAKLGMSQQMEAQSQTIDLSSAVTTMVFDYTSYSGIRAAFIGPSPKITSVTSQKIVEVDNASCLRVDYPMKLFSAPTAPTLAGPGIATAFDNRSAPAKVFSSSDIFFNFTESFTIGGWINPSSLNPGFQFVMGKGISTLDRQYLFAYNSTNNFFNFQVRYDNGNSVASRSRSIPPGVYTFFIAKFNHLTNTVSLAINDGSYTSTSFVGTINSPNVNPFRIGGLGNVNTGLNGIFDEIFIMDSEISDTLRGSIYNLGFGKTLYDLTGPERDMIKAWYPMDETSQQSDIKGNYPLIAEGIGSVSADVGKVAIPAHNGSGEDATDQINEIESIDGNEITFKDDWKPFLENDMVIKLPNYDEANASQKSRFAYIGFNAGTFNDGTKSYQILF